MKYACVQGAYLCRCNIVLESNKVNTHKHGKTNV